MFHMAGGYTQREEWEQSPGARPRSSGPECTGEPWEVLGAGWPSRAVRGQTGMGRLRTGRMLERKEWQREDRRPGLGTGRLVGWVRTMPGVWPMMG